MSVDPVRCTGLHPLAPLGHSARPDTSLLLPIGHPYGTTLARSLEPIPQWVVLR